ncbi:nectin-3-like protein [Trichomycterus rosablanca]|uniref:nectin-3-like protein n=1 Tax=Trichomycterus rosablanca TaxID=2290929 RepID=UPI002F35091E
MLIQLVLLLLVFTGVCSNKVLVPESVKAVLGKNATLSCRVEVGASLSLTQSSWERRSSAGTVTLAVFNPAFGISVSEEYEGRVHFLNPSVEDASIVLEEVGFADIGSYTCKAVTFPLGNTQASTNVDVLVEPKVYVFDSGPLVDGAAESVVATCAAERARPPAEVFWKADVYGRTQQSIKNETDGTTTAQVQYIWAPSSHAFNHVLTCVVRHPALDMDFQIPYVLNVQFAPDIMVVGQDEVWYAGQKNAKLDCRANANPPPYRFLWTRLDMKMPEGVVTANGTLVFTRPLQKNDSGTYRCEVQNDIKVHFQDVDIWVRDPPPTTPFAITTNAALPSSSSTSSSQLRARLSSPTLTSLPDGTVGTVVGGAVGGILILVLLLALAALCYLRQRRTFRGDYYTKQYMVPSDMQRDSHELHNAFEDDSATSSQDLKPKPEADGDVSYHSYTKNEEWGSYYPENKKINTIAPLNDGGPYHQDNDMGTEYVSHVDGSVISRREWYV